MGKFSDFKKNKQFVAWDMDAGCRHIVNQTSPGRRRCKKILKHQERAILKERSRQEEFEEEPT